MAGACLLLVSIGASASAPAGRYTVTTDTATDSATGLIWQRNVDANSRTWADAQAYCSSLSLGGWSSGWRLPTVKELQSIVDTRSHAPAIDSTAFPSTPASYSWSASPFISSYAWSVDFYDGATKAGLTDTTLRARCVR